MGAQTGISWTEKTWNGAIGCSRVSPGCSNCYAERMAATKFRHFTGGPVWGRSNPRYVTSDQLWRAPLKWARDARRTGVRVKVFGNSLYDFCEDAPQIDAIRPRLWELVDATRDAITWQFITKRPERLAECLPRSWGPFWAGVWLGTSIETAAYAARADHLRAVQAEVRFLSVEPALGPVADSVNLSGIDWCIWGGESGPGYRPADQQWARDLLAACQQSGAAFFYKQSAGARSGMNPTLDGVAYHQFPTPRSP
jgi:protein gp37